MYKDEDDHIICWMVYPVPYKALPTHVVGPRSRVLRGLETLNATLLGFSGFAS